MNAGTEERTAIAEVDLSRVEGVREAFPAFADRQLETTVGF